VSQGVRQAMAQLQPALPQGMRMATVFDSADYTQKPFD
jgi:multidrug efflux pump subunit AcrB